MRRLFALAWSQRKKPLADEMTPNVGSYILFTDLDGTLLDFETYSFAESQPHLQRLLSAGLQVVFCSSKTLAEQLSLMAAMEIHVPAIVENGGAIYWPKPRQCADPSAEDCGTLIPLGPSAIEIQSLLFKAEQQLGIELKSYAQIGPQGIVELTGLSFSDAERAGKRCFSETFTAQIDPEQAAILQRYLSQRGLQIQCGGRFHTVTGKGVDKGNAVRRFLLGPEIGHRFDGQCSIGVGDGPNDAAMLLAVDQAFLVKNHRQQWAEIDLPHLQRLERAGPEGWIQLAEQLLTDS
jgi:mannosyl-3-phosphoglycerate phosphatase family protein